MQVGGTAFILKADDFFGACCRKAMNPPKLWTLLFPTFVSLQTKARKWRNSQKWVGEEAKGILDPESKGESLLHIRTVFCTSATPFCTSAIPLCTSARRSRSLGPKDPFGPSPRFAIVSSKAARFCKSRSCHFGYSVLHCPSKINPPPTL